MGASARSPCTLDDVEFYSLKRIRHLCKCNLSTAYALAIWKQSNLKEAADVVK